MRTALLIAGCHRSGTSALAHALGQLGWQLPRNLLAGNDGSGEIYWEPPHVVALNDRILAAVGRSWLDPKPFDVQPLLTNDWVTRAQQAFATEFPGDAPVAVKDPRLSLLLPVWRAALTELGIRPVVIIACRNPCKVSQSLARRDGLTLEHGEALWIDYMLSAERHSRGLPRAVVHYEDFVSVPSVTLDAALQQIGERAAVPVASWQAVRQSIRSDKPSLDQTNSVSTTALVIEVAGLFRKHDALGDTMAFEHAWSAWWAHWSAIGPGGGPSQLALARPETHAWAAIAAAEAGSLDEARAAAARGAALLSAVKADGPQIHEIVRDAFVAAGALSEALVQARQVVELMPQNAHALHHLARLELETGNAATAEAGFRRALALAPEAAHTQHSLGTLLVKSGRPGEALPLLQAAAQALADDPQAQADLALLFEQLGNRTEARAVLSRAAERQPHTGGYHTLLAGIQARSGDLAAAEHSFRKALAISPADANARASLAMILMDRGLVGEALPHLESAIAAFPDHDVLRQLHAKAKAYLAAETGRSQRE